MLHLPTERLAALSDEPPSSEEAAHLSSCSACATEQRAYESLLALSIAERDSFGLPLTRWDSIAAALGQQPVVRPVIAQPHRSNHWMLQIAAGLLLVAGGTIMGRMSVGGRPFPNQSSVETASVAAPAVRQNPDSIFFNSADDARIALQRSEVVYQQAVAFLSRFDSTNTVTGSPVALRSRLAALDGMISTTREAMRDAPHDPVMNGYYLSTLGQREATLRQLNTSLPETMRVNSF